MSAHPIDPPQDADEDLHFELLTLSRLEALLEVEESAYSHPWTRGNFIDAMASGYQMQLLLNDEALLGYFVAMQGVDEVHLLNITVAPDHQRKGFAHLLLQALVLWARSQNAQWLWLEVRVSNTRAREIYEKFGFRRVGERKRYYPADMGEREDAVVMSIPL
ncbi:ribosomal protein S18-alanine N-acetyltransferase [Diaphorobacter aerolatus]|uniref:[Ribosomal protein bS18]-alanine N-acetyltransferase n=1 Tax=Diaphorobacter aerolatus TaxID=1288495 RepID=A0A7H0GH01_9BURK|nr:ribosomal protein S18-alanine N-acetyltransferase [Diaphorobacter aerolatus]QNP47567.1 ribosomal protein S18-alanine N-acetyltransferase [Diaphorobacter aerolatus]